jgi:hypothetical protein
MVAGLVCTKPEFMLSSRTSRVMNIEPKAKTPTAVATTTSAVRDLLPRISRTTLRQRGSRKFMRGSITQGPMAIADKS